jgi:two-component system response regulator NreC
MNKIRLLLVDDHAVVRTGIKMLLESQPDMVILGEAKDGAEALMLSRDLVPDIVIMDLTLPDISGIHVTRQLKQENPDIAVIALTIHEDEQYFFEMLQSGASGYVPKRAASEDLITAIRTAYKGDIYIYPSLTKTLVTDFLGRDQHEQENNLIEELTSREAEVLSLLAEGLSNEQIGDHLSISKHTVARHREHIMRKLGLHSRSDLVKFAIRRGLITP